MQLASTTRPIRRSLIQFRTHGGGWRKRAAMIAIYLPVAIGLLAGLPLILEARPSSLQFGSVGSQTVVTSAPVGSQEWIDGIRVGRVVAGGTGSMVYFAEPTDGTSGPVGSPTSRPSLSAGPWLLALGALLLGILLRPFGLLAQGLAVTLASAIAVQSLEGAVWVPEAALIALIPLVTAALIIRSRSRAVAIAALASLAVFAIVIEILIALPPLDGAAWAIDWAMPSIAALAVVSTVGLYDTSFAVRTWRRLPARKRTASALFSELSPMARRGQLIAMEDERERLALWVHNVLLPSIAQARRALEKDPGAQEAQSDLDHLEGQLRKVMNDRQLVVLRSGGLAWAIDALVEEARADGFECTLEEDAPNRDVRLPQDVETAAYRIAQEALNNARKHAGTNAATVTLRIAPDHVELHVMDEGVGVGAGRATDGRAHIGLMEMRQRAADVDGTLTVLPRDPAGTDVCFRWSR